MEHWQYSSTISVHCDLSLPPPPSPTPRTPSPLSLWCHYLITIHPLTLNGESDQVPYNKCLCNAVLWKHGHPSSWHHGILTCIYMTIKVDYKEVWLCITNDSCQEIKQLPSNLLYYWFFTSASMCRLAMLHSTMQHEQHRYLLILYIYLCLILPMMTPIM